MHILFFFLFINQIFTAEIDHYLTEPYVDLDWTKIAVSKIEVHFINEISRSDFKRIYLTNSTSGNEIDIINNCFFYSNSIRCFVSPKVVNGDPDNKKYKFYYRLMYEDSEGNKSSYVTISVNNGFIIKYSLFFLIFLIF
jgi:hypothetical protein